MAVVTGGTSGIRRAIAVTFAAHGAYVHLFDRIFKVNVKGAYNYLVAEIAQISMSYCVR